MRPHLVFTGPTLSHKEAQRIADVICLPPAAQGSIVAAVHQYDPAAILIIDGTFQTEPAVRHKEILWAISRSVTVIGAASMGALRAAELFPHMYGVGFIYRWYRRFAFAPDDAVAVLHGPKEVNFSPLTRSLVDLRITIRAAQRRDLIPLGLARTLDRAARALNFRDRTLSRVVGEAMPNATSDELNACREILTTAFIQQKKRDAISALQLLRENIPEPSALHKFIFTSSFSLELEDSDLKP